MISPICVAVAILAGSTAIAVDTNLVANLPPRPEDNASQEALRNYHLQLQEQLNAVKLALERSQKEAELSATRDAEALSRELDVIKQALASEQSRELRAMQSSNRVMLIVAGGFAGLGFLAMMLMAYFQWRTVGRLVAMSSGFPAFAALGESRVGISPSLLPPGPGELATVSVSPADQSSQRLLGALEQLERRIHELEHRPPATLPDGGGNGSPDGNGSREEAVPGAEAARINLLLGKGESLQSIGKDESALTCFEEILAVKPGHTEALLKKGQSLERLGRLDDAIGCYDQAIAADVTIAYLYKGGLFNRMERFDEALACYEQALKRQQS